MKSELDPRYEINEEGIWSRIEYTNSMTMDVDLMYNDERINEVIRNDVGHYRGLHATFKLHQKRLFETHYDICYAFGGGIPKFETYLNVQNIKVIDGMANKYIPFTQAFRKWYGFTGDIEYEQLILNSNIISRYPYDINKKMILTFIHFLEHQSLDEHLKILKDLPKNIDVLVYGPNVSKYLYKDWIHGRDWILDHNTFIPYKKFLQILEDLNYKIYFSAEYSDDLLFYFNTGDK